MRSCRFRHPLLSVLCALLLVLAAGACGAREPASPLIVARDGQSQITIIPDWLNLRDLTHDEAQIQVGSRLLNQYLIVLTEPRPADVPLALFAKIGIEQLMSGIEGAQTTGPVEAQIGGLPAQRFEAIGVHDGHRLGYLYYALQGTRNQYQIVAWCAAEDFPRLKPTFQAVAETFREIVR